MAANDLSRRMPALLQTTCQNRSASQESAAGSEWSGLRVELRRRQVQSEQCERPRRLMNNQLLLHRPLRCYQYEGL